MSSGEWNLCALKALEEEEQKEFLALSQKSLFESVCLPTGEDLLHQTGDLSHSNFQPKVSYAQQHPHLLKLPTINECNLIAAARRRRFRLLQQSTSGSSKGERQLQITRVLSLSAHSLTERSNRNQKNVALSETNDKMSQISGSTQFYNVSPFYTPPSIKRCETSHPKSFKNSLQDLKKQKTDHKRDGTNKSHSKYGSNSTAASVPEERKKLHTSLLESYTSDENDSEKNSINIDQSDHWIKTCEDCDDSATEAGSCSVPLGTDSVDAIRLMLSAATAAITYTSKSDNTPVSASMLTTVKLDGHRTSPQTNHSNNLLKLSSSSAAESTYNGVRNETKEKRERSLTDDSYVNNDVSKCNNKKSRHPLVTARYLNSCHKANLLDVSMEFNGCLQDNKADNTVWKCNVKTSPIAQSIELTKPAIKNGLDILSNFSCNKTVWMKSKPIVTNKPNNHIQNLLLHATHGENLHHSLIRCKDVVKEESLKNYNDCKNPLSMGILPIAERPNWSSFAQLHHQFIDDELEEHIKQCSCSCNHMGYGNSMDYQAIGFGGLPDVTEHSNTRRTHSRQNSISNSDSGGEIANANKSKSNLCDSKSPQTGQTTPVERKSKITHHAAAARCSRAHRLKPRRGSCAIVLTFVGTICLLTIGALLAYQHFMAPSRNSHAQRLKIVRRILKEVPLVDGHNNFAWNVRKYAQNSLELISMRRDPDAEAWTRPTWAQTDIERLKQGLVGVQMWSAYVPCEALGLDAVQVAIEQIDIIRRLTDMNTLDTMLAKSSKDIFIARQRHQMASLIGIKGGHAIGSSLAVLRSFYSVGARALSLTHKCDLSWAGSSASETENGLSAFGKVVIREMNRLGMMVDLSYSSAATARDVLQITRAPVIFSHSAARQICNSTQNIPDDILRLVADNGGLIMVSFDPEDVACGQPAYLADVIKHIKHIRAIAGVQHIGLGAGYDGIEEPPIGLEDVSKYPDLLATLLQDHNWSEQDIAMLAGKNFLRILETVENVRDYWKRADIQPLEQTEPQPKPQCSYMSS
ncbi:PREDICTED: uncharacterized protein LOC108975068 isoform X1 [Bactrocera latifrons]|uniref:Dipeptidase n=1 Tax=Bactrocera latifrons TaxID=174628 RepID=A0A0K8W5C7_BACLA|nr:PREDICTED: uncharacterized protein LOC108975068 isoform X1 [Bactrocera latifrons]